MGNVSRASVPKANVSIARVLVVSVPVASFSGASVPKANVLIASIQLSSVPGASV